MILFWIIWHLIWGDDKKKTQNTKWYCVIRWFCCICECIFMCACRWTICQAFSSKSVGVECTCINVFLALRFYLFWTGIWETNNDAHCMFFLLNWTDQLQMKRKINRIWCWKFKHRKLSKSNSKFIIGCCETKRKSWKLNEHKTSETKNEKKKNWKNRKYVISWAKWNRYERSCKWKCSKTKCTKTKPKNQRTRKIETLTKYYCWINEKKITVEQQETNKEKKRIKLIQTKRKKGKKTNIKAYTSHICRNKTKIEFIRRKNGVANDFSVNFCFPVDDFSSENSGNSISVKKLEQEMKYKRTKNCSHLFFCRSRLSYLCRCCFFFVYIYHHASDSLCVFACHIKNAKSA